MSDISADVRNNLTSMVQRSLSVRSRKPEVMWIDESQLLARTDATLALAAIIPAAGSIPDSLYCCTVDSRFLNGTVFTLRTAVKVAQSNQYTGAGVIGTSLPKIYPTAKWAKYLNPIIPGSNTTVFTTMAATAGLWSNLTLPPAFLLNTEPALEQIVVTLLANGLGRMNFNFTLAGRAVADSGRQIMSKNGGIDYGGDAFDITPEEQDKATKFQLSATVTGYAYAPDGPIQKAALAVLAFYSAVIIAYVIYLLCTKSPTGPNWGTPAEIAALAWNSDRTEDLQNTGAGITSMAIFENKVCIRTDGENLHLISGTTDYGGLVERDRYYG